MTRAVMVGCMCRPYRNPRGILLAAHMAAVNALVLQCVRHSQVSNPEHTAKSDAASAAMKFCLSVDMPNSRRLFPV